MTNTLSKTDYLLVPINVQAAIVNQAVINCTPYDTEKMDYRNLSTFNSLSAGPFSDADDRPEDGVHVLWDLPAAFRQGMHNPNSDAPPEYPVVPNRWLVARFWPGGGSTARQCKAWIINSDDRESGSSPYVNTAAKAIDSWTTKFGSVTEGGYTIGAVRDIADWQEQTGAGYAIASAGGNSITLSGSKDLSGLIFPGGKIVVINNSGVYGPFTVEKIKYDSEAFSITTTVPIDTKAGDSSGTVAPVQAWFPVSSNTTNTFVIQSAKSLNTIFPVNAFFYVSGSTKNDGAYQISETVFDVVTGNFTITVDGSIPDSGANNGVLYADTRFINFLQAPGPGSVTFSSFRPNVENVFSLVDDGTDNNGDPLINDAEYTIESAGGTTITVSTASPSKLSGVFVNGSNLVIYNGAGWFGPFSVKSSSPGKNDFTITTTGELDADADSGLVIPVQQPYDIASSTVNTFTINANSDLSSLFPRYSFFYVTGSTHNNNSYQVEQTSFNSQNNTFTITVGGSGGTIVKPGATDGVLSGGGANQFVNMDYLIMGWYSSRNVDPLYETTDPASWAGRLSELNWATNPGPYPVKSVVINQHSGQSEIILKGTGNLTDQFSAGDSISVMGNGATVSYTLGSGTDAPVYNRASDSTVLTVTSLVASPGPDEQLYVIPESFAEQTLPQNTLVHGQLNGVTWSVNTVPHRPNLTEIDVNRNVRVAVGNSSIDALSAALVRQQQDDLSVSSITGAKAYSGIINEASSPICLNGIKADLTKDWFPVGSSILLSKTSGIPLGTYRIAATLFDENASEFFIYTAGAFALPVDGEYPFSLNVTPTYLDADLLDAFQTNRLSLLDQPGGRAGLDMALRKEAFKPEDGGVLWKLQAIVDKPVFTFAIAGVDTGASPGFTINTKNYSSNTSSGLADLFSVGTFFTVTGKPGDSPAGKYVVSSTVSSSDSFTITTTTSPVTTAIGETNTIKVTGSRPALPISYPVQSVLKNPLQGFSIQWDEDLSSRFPVNATFTVTGPANSAAGTYTVSGVDYSKPPIFVIHTTTAPGNSTISSDNRIELDNSSLAGKRAGWLADINLIQRNLDREIRILQSIQSECYAWWWQANYLSKNTLPDNLSNTQQKDLYNAFGDEQAGLWNKWPL